MKNLHLGKHRDYEFDKEKKWLIPQPALNSDEPELKETYQVKFFNEYFPSSHRIFDRTWYKDISILNEKGDVVDIYEVNRVALPIQQMAIDVILAHLLGNPIHIEDSTHIDNPALTPYKEYWETKNIETAIYHFVKSVLSLGDGAVLFYKSESALRFKVLSLFTHDKYHMEKDKFGDDKKFYHYYEDNCDVYEKDKVTTFTKNESGEWGSPIIKQHGFSEMPVVYYKRESGPFWTPVQSNIENAEKMMSRLSEDNRSKFKSLYHLASSNPDSVETVKAGTMDMVITDKDGKFNMIQGAEMSLQFKFEYESQMDIISNTLGIVFPKHKSSGDMPTGSMKMMFYPTERIVMSLIHEFDAHIDRMNDIIIKAFASESPEHSKNIVDGNIRVSIRMFTPQDDSSKVKDIVELRRNNIISTKTASSESPYASNDEVTRMKAEVEEDMIIERKKQDLRII